jgi:acyl-coenzyme A thioesterase PaaI-like protein
MEEIFESKDPSNRCFACSPHNEHGLRMNFVRTGPRSVESHYSVEPYLCGATGVVHGGIQATLLDDTMGKAAQLHMGLGWEQARIATVEFRIRYRRPVPVEKPLTIRAELVRTEGRDLYMKGQILNAAEEVLTTAEARWRELDMPSE